MWPIWGTTFGSSLLAPGDWVGTRGSFTGRSPSPFGLQSYLRLGSVGAQPASARSNPTGSLRRWDRSSSAQSTEAQHTQLFCDVEERKASTPNLSTTNDAFFTAFMTGVPPQRRTSTCRRTDVDENATDKHWASHCRQTVFHYNKQTIKQSICAYAI